MNAISRTTGREGSLRWVRGLALVATVWGASALAQVVTVPAAHLNHAEGTVALSPQGDTEWHDVQPRRVLKRGDRLWTDRGSRAEIQAGGHAVRLDSQTQVILENASDNATQLSLTQGSMVITVTRVNPGDTVEIGTPNLAFRARQPGDYRVDVDTKSGTTRVVVQSGTGVVYGEKGEALELHTGQRAIFRARDLARVQQGAFAANDDFDRWAGARRRGEPTVSMPSVAQAAPATPPPNALVNRGRDIIISGPAASLPGSKLAAKEPAVAAAPVPASARPQFQIKGPPVMATAPVAPVPAAPPATPAAPPATAPVAAAAPVIKAQVIPTVPVVPNTPAAAPLRVTAPASTQLQQAQAQADAALRAQARAAEQAAQKAAAEQVAREQKAAAAQKAAADQAARDQARAAEAQARAAREQQRVAAQQEEQRRAAARRDEDRQAAASAKRADERRRSVAAARRAEEERHQLQARKAEDARHAAAEARREQEHKRQLAAKKAAEEKRLAALRKEEERRQAAARAAEEKKLAEARLRHLTHLREQAGREEANAREQQARRAEQDKQEQARRDDQARRDEQARRDDADRRQRQLAEQWRKDQEKKDQEVWLRQQQAPLQPMRPVPMGVPFRRVS
ncbi:hypothetical protein HHL11_04475 [Ramlibacter sp. G-1-2-2]|uniref:FecR protein domain-containing protein n=1 Tax=Ramlibacter agri TaxID=2728837 RepID=A0A848GWL4_9BURK|nr:FecR family protein [Ramlibacter agri]NML42995.1 hypothetical protein [Ramlibacter agri]